VPEPKLVDRRGLLKGVVGTAALPWLAQRVAFGDQQARSPVKLSLGISTLGFPNYSNRELAVELAKAGIRTIQLFLNQKDSRYWRYNGRTDVSDLTDARCRAIADAYRSAGIAIHSLGVYTNLIHPDRAEREANLAYFEAMMKIARSMGVRYLITEAGHYRSEGPEPPVPFHFQEAVWRRTVAVARRLAEMAERHDVVVLVEPYFAGFFASAKRTRVFLEEVGSPRLRALLDPANLLEVNDLDEMFSQLGPWVDCLHAKDRKLHVEAGVPAGEGDVDYRRFVSLAVRRTPHAPLILEYVGPDNYRKALESVRRALREAGVQEA